MLQQDPLLRCLWYCDDEGEVLWIESRTQVGDKNEE